MKFISITNKNLYLLKKFYDEFVFPNLSHNSYEYYVQQLDQKLHIIISMDDDGISGGIMFNHYSEIKSIKIEFCIVGMKYRKTELFSNLISRMKSEYPVNHIFFEIENNENMCHMCKKKRI